jgi:mannose-6-phosphate isomerase
VCLDGAGRLEHAGSAYAVGKGDVFLLPAVVGVCTFRQRSVGDVLEIAIPDSDRENAEGGAR